MGNNYDRYISYVKGKKIAVIGIGLSNIPLIKLLLRAGAKVTAYDKMERAEFGVLAEELESLGAKLKLGGDYLSDLRGDIIYRTPGMRPDVPELTQARKRGAVITSEMETFFEVCPCRIIGVTGSDGKTTTTTIIAEMLRTAGYTCHLGGNIGRPLLADADGMMEDDIAAVELSSFQLMTMNKSPDIAVITNISPNHLDVHKSIEEYIAAKENIFRHQRAGRLVINHDNDITRCLAAKARNEVTFFGTGKSLTKGVALEDGTIFVRDGHRSEGILPVKNILLPGAHNVENYMAATAAVYDLVGAGAINEVAGKFKGVEHRIEHVRRLNGVDYYNDSIASSPTRTIAGLKSFDREIILIAGGYDKKIAFDELGAAICEHVKTLVLTGATAPLIKEAVLNSGIYNGRPRIFETPDFDDAVRSAASVAKEGDAVLLSPACASFDSFKNFAERGDAFKKLVYELQ